MKNLTVETMTLAIVGLLIHALMKVKKRKSKSPLSFGVWIKENWLTSIISCLCSFAILILSDSVASIMNIKLPDGSPAYDIIALFGGYSNQSLFHNIFGIFKGKIK